MHTNMTTPGQAQFDWIMATWWVELNHAHAFQIPLATGGADPMLDWIHQRESDQIWYYSQLTWQEDDFVSRFWLAQHMPEFLSVHVTSALYLTSMISEHMLHDLEIPGVWMVRVQKT